MKSKLVSSRKVAVRKRPLLVEPEYRQALVSYVDILGFRDLLTSQEQSPAEIRRTVVEVQRHLTHDYEDFEELASSVVDIAFSDTLPLVRYLPEPGEPRIGVLFHEVNHLLLAQAALLSKGILIRGGITLGGVFVDKAKEVWFGPGMGVSEILCARIGDLSTVAVVACDERPTRWASRTAMLLDRSGEAVAVGDRELVHRGAPFLGCAAPVRRDVAHGQPDQLGGGIVAWEVPARLDDLA